MIYQKGADSGRWYSNLFKKELRAETYLNLPQFKFRKLIAKFRCSDHQLRIESGRHQKLEIAQRTGDMCKSGKVENEIHFLIECEAYRDLRQTFLGPNLNRILTATQIEYAFINVLTAQDISRQKNFAQFLQQATELRTKNLSEYSATNCLPLKMLQHRVAFKRRVCSINPR